MASVQIHLITGNREIKRQWACHVPRPGDEIRIGGVGSEKFYTVERVVWVYDEPENSFDRVNIGVVEST